MGLGWMLFDWGGRRIIGHDGATLGQSSYLRIDPASGTVVSLLTTGGDSGALYRDVFEAAMSALCGIHLPPLPEESVSVNVSLPPYTGRYERLSMGYVVEIEDGALILSARGKKSPWNLVPPVRTKLRAISREAFVVEQPSGLVGSPVLFGDFDEVGRPGYVEIGLRTTPRVCAGGMHL